MTNKSNSKVETETVKAEIVEDFDEGLDDFDDMEIENLIPSMTINTEITEPEKECIVKDDQLLSLYDEILNNCRKDRESVNEVLLNFIDMVMNEGDATPASKEAIVNLMKVNTDINDKMSKIADLETRIKLKEKDTYPRYLAAQQNNKVVIEGSKREMIKTINKLAQRKQNDKQN